MSDQPPGPPGYGHPPPQYGYQSPGGAYGAPGPRTGRPGTVWTASILSWLGSVVGILLGALFAVFSQTQTFRDTFRDSFGQSGGVEARRQLRQSGVTLDQLIDVVGVLGWLLVGASVFALVLAVLAFARQNWARILLTVLGGLAAAGYLLAGLAAPPVWLFAGYIIVALVLFYVGGANAWYRGHRAQSTRPAQPW